MNGRFIAYYRVSTQRQGISGLGLEAQKQAVRTYLNGGKWELLAELTEIESGKNNERPKLQEALTLCRKHRATLLIAKLDRLSRNVAFVANLLESKIEFLAVDNPHADKTFLQMCAVFAEHEREMISKRTREALAAAKKRGKKLGWSNPSRADQSRATAKAAVLRRSQANKFAANILPIIKQIKANGVATLTGIAFELNQRNVKSPTGGQWYASSVRNLLSRNV